LTQHIVRSRVSQIDDAERVNEHRGIQRRRCTACARHADVMLFVKLGVASARAASRAVKGFNTRGAEETFNTTFNLGAYIVTLLARGPQRTVHYEVGTQSTGR